MASNTIDWGKLFHESLMRNLSLSRQSGKSWFQEQYQQQFYSVGIDHSKDHGTTFTIAHQGPNGTIIIDDIFPYETRTGDDARDCSVEWNDHLLGHPGIEPLPPHRKRKGERKRGAWRLV